MMMKLTAMLMGADDSQHLQDVLFCVFRGDRGSRGGDHLIFSFMSPEAIDW